MPLLPLQGGGLGAGAISVLVDRRGVNGVMIVVKSYANLSLQVHHSEHPTQLPGLVGWHNHRDHRPSQF